MGNSKLKINTIYNEDCIKTMEAMEDNFIDLTVTSPPYDNLRKYNGYSFDFENIARHLYRVTKEGGVLVWIVSDATLDGSETGTSFKQALFFMQCGFNLHDTMIWCKDGGGAIGSHYTYTQNFEYMFVFSKGRPKTTNLLYDKVSKSYNGKGKKIKESRGGFDKDRGTTVFMRREYSKRNNWWLLVPQEQEGSSWHPAVFPEKLASDHIVSWSNEGDLVYDPFCGSGTTCKMAAKYKRNFIGSEISKEYCEKSLKRVKNEIIQPQLF